MEKGGSTARHSVTFPMEYTGTGNYELSVLTKVCWQLKSQATEV